jgi:chaperone required for assembly of F1-ATPase
VEVVLVCGKEVQFVCVEGVLKRRDAVQDCVEYVEKGVLRHCEVCVLVKMVVFVGSVVLVLVLVIVFVYVCVGFEFV